MWKIICKFIFFIGIIVIFSSKSYAYNDITEEYWAYEFINKLSEKNILSGYPDGSFKGDNNITRAEFITLLMKALGKNTDVSIDSGYWASKNIIAAEENGMLKIDEYCDFDPDIPITRREICFMIYRSIKNIEMIDMDKLSNKRYFRDIDINNAEETNAVTILSCCGLLSGYPDDTVKLEKNSTRAEACTFINNYLKYQYTILAAINENIGTNYDQSIAVTDLVKLPSQLKKWQFANDLPYLTTELREIVIFPFADPPEEFETIFNSINSGNSQYLEYRKKFGENNFVIAVKFRTVNNTDNDELYTGYEFLHISFLEEEIRLIDSFDCDEMVRQANGNANIGENVKGNETKDTSAFYIVDKKPERKIRFDRNIIGEYEVPSFHSLIVNLEGR